MHHFNRLRISLLALIALFALTGEARERISLDGTWLYTLTDSVAPDVARSGSLTLPGTLDTNGIGNPVADSAITDQLSRRVAYTGPAVFSRTIEIPQSAAGKDIILHMERTRPTSVKVDGLDAGSLRTISSPQRYDLSPLLTPGTHTIEITVDNGTSIPSAVRNSSHACAESTQTNWNGIIGEFYLELIDPTHLSDLTILRNPANKPETESGESLSISGMITGREPDKSYVITATAAGQRVTLPLDTLTSDRFSLTLPVNAIIPFAMT